MKVTPTMTTASGPHRTFVGAASEDHPRTVNRGARPSGKGRVSQPAQR
jgi:hypothetical protein